MRHFPGRNVQLSGYHPESLNRDGSLAPGDSNILKSLVLVKLTLTLWGCQGDGYLNLYSEQDFPTVSRFLSSLVSKSGEMWEKYLGLLNVSGLCHVHYSISDKLNVIRALANRFLFSVDGIQMIDQFPYSQICPGVNWIRPGHGARHPGPLIGWNLLQIKSGPQPDTAWLPGTRAIRSVLLDSFRCGAARGDREQNSWVLDTEVMCNV